MKTSAYDSAKGFIVTYKPLYETLLFNELNAKCNNIKLFERGKISSAFTTDDYNQIVNAIREEGFIFLQHIHPYSADCGITGCMDDLTAISEMLNVVVPYIEDDDSIVVQCRIDTDKVMEFSNRDLTNKLAERLNASGYHVEPREAEICISVTVFQNRAYMGISLIKDNVSDWTGGILFFSKENIISRAEFKIEEAFKVFDININNNMRALDLGAAPGGWTHFLSEKGICVDAVDPACLDDRVLNSDRVTHFKMTAQEFMRLYPEKCYDIIVNDMRMDTNESVDIMACISEQLKPDGICILTLKLPKKNVQKRINIAREVLSKRFKTVKIRQLYYNLSEVTAFLKNKI